MGTTKPPIDHRQDDDGGAAVAAPDAAAESFFAELAQLVDSGTDGDADAAAVPPVFANVPLWEPWREDRVFQPRPPTPLPRRHGMAAPVATANAQDVGEAALGPMTPTPNAVAPSGFRRMLAPVAIVSSLALAALTHGAVADRSGPVGGSPATVSPSSTEAPFSLTGAWRGLPVSPNRDPAAVPVDEALITANPPPLPASPPVDSADARVVTQQPDTRSDPGKDGGEVGLPYLQVAIDAIGALPIEPAVLAAREPETPSERTAETGGVTLVAPPAESVEHPSRQIATPLTELMPVEPWFVARSAGLVVAVHNSVNIQTGTLAEVLKAGMRAATVSPAGVDSKSQPAVVTTPVKAKKPAPEPEEEAPPPKAKPAPKPATPSFNAFSAPAATTKTFDASMRDSP
ncbi:MAG: hypothetical protein ACKVP7_08460 [Hyphomicrobiaceae bacterium]